MKKMKKMLSKLGAAIFVLLLTFSVASSGTAQNLAWSTTVELPASRGAGSSIAYNDRVYIIGGERSGATTPEEHSVNTVYLAVTNPDGTVGAWQSSTPLPSARSGHATVVHDGKIYVLGGIGPPIGASWSEKAHVWYASIHADGTIGEWLSTTQLPHPLFPSNGAVVWNGRIYVVGGWSGGSGWLSDIWYSEINPDGSLGSWKTTSPLTEPRHNARAVVHDGIIYIIGGQYGHPGNFRKTVYYARINSDGTLDAWSATTSLPSERWYHSAVVVHNAVYVIGGWDSSLSATDTVYSAPINTDGTVGSWIEETPLPERRTAHFSVVNRNRIYVIGGSDGTLDEIQNIVYKDAVYYSPVIDNAPDTELWKQWWLWTNIALGITTGVFALTTIYYRKKALTPEKSKTQSTKAASKELKVCPNCGANLPADSKFCGECGTSLS